MKLKHLTLASLLTFAVATSTATDGSKLVILHTNDTHSQIDPNASNNGGIARRKVLIDSVRSVHPEVMLVDAGDAVQGTLYFSLFGGEVEQKLMNELRYDIQIAGNHEFDNGIKALAKYLKGSNAIKLSSNYRINNSLLQDIFEPYTIRKVGNKKVGFIGINLNPKGIISDANYSGIEYHDGIEAANAYAWILKNMEGCDMVVAITHIGYSDEKGYVDTALAEQSDNIDVIIGGHSHTTINPSSPKSTPWRIANAAGDSVLIAQTGKGGAYLGEIVLDLESRRATSRLISVDKRLDNRIDPAFEALILPYRTSVDSVRNIKLGYATDNFLRSTPALDNLIADAVGTLGGEYSGRHIDLAIMNHGGLRTDLHKGVITKGDIMEIMPFDNYIVVMEILGSDLQEALDVIAGRKGTDGISSNARATFKDGKCTSATIDGKPLDPEKTYLLATIDYLANGGDYMSSLSRGKVIARSEVVLYDDIISLFTTGIWKGKKLSPDTIPRFTEDK